MTDKREETNGKNPKTLLIPTQNSGTQPIKPLNNEMDTRVECHKQSEQHRPVHVTVSPTCHQQTECA